MSLAAALAPSSDLLPEFNDVLAAAARLAGHVVRTPLLESEVINSALSARVLFKAENMQRTGSFKFRGAFNRLSMLSTEERARGVFAYSSGNHGNGVATAARLFGINAVIAMPEDTPQAKLKNVAANGAKIITYDRVKGDRDAIAREQIGAGRVVIHPYDDAMVIAGQGTVALEILDQCKTLGVRPDTVIAPCGGGGLTSGMALVLAQESPLTEVFGVEPEGYDDTRRSLEAGARVGNDAAAPSVCDAIMTPMPGELSFAINRRLISGVTAVSDTATAHAMGVAARQLKTVVEPGGAVALAALLERLVEIRNRTVICILSGGNVDLTTFARLIEGQDGATP